MPDRVSALGGFRPARALRRTVVVLVLFAVVGALAGVVWEWVWAPPTGVVLDHQFLLDGEGLRSAFSGTALYVLVASLAGLLLGVGVAVLCDGSELLTLAAVVVGAVLAAWLMHLVGTSLGPPDPGPVAERSEDLTRLPDELRVSGWSPFVAFPSGALLGVTVVFVGLAGRRRADGFTEGRRG